MEKLRCEICNGPIKNVWGKRKKTARFCSVRCKGEFQKSVTGPESRQWKGGRNQTTCGYIRIRVDKSYIYEHRYIMEQFLGRKLRRDETIHHLNGDRTDNRIENLRLMNKRDHDREETLKRHRNKMFYIPLKRPDITLAKIKPLQAKGYSIRKIACILETAHNTIRHRLARA